MYTKLYVPGAGIRRDVRRETGDDTTLAGDVIIVDTEASHLAVIKKSEVDLRCHC